LPKEIALTVVISSYSSQSWRRAKIKKEKKFKKLNEQKEVVYNYQLMSAALVSA